MKTSKSLHSVHQMMESESSSDHGDSSSENETWRMRGPPGVKRMSGRGMFPRLGDDDSSSGDDTRSGLWGLARIDENGAPVSLREGGPLGRVSAGTAGTLQRPHAVPSSGMFARDTRPAWVSAALLHRLVHRICACVQSKHCGVARSAIDMCDPQGSSHTASFARTYMPSSRLPRVGGPAALSQLDAAFSTVLLSSPPLARRVAVALHAAATNHWSRGVRERAYTVASRLTLVCGIPVGPDEEDEEAENSGPHASPRTQLLASAVASMTLAGAGAGHCGRTASEPQPLPLPLSHTLSHALKHTAVSGVSERLVFAPATVAQDRL